MQAAPSLKYMPQLDALRALAVLAVMVHHFLPVDRYIPTDYITLGFLAVRLFFVLSGFLITGILLNYRSDERGNALRRFYLRRVLRIFPIYYLTLFIALALQVRSIQQGAFWHLTYLSNYVAPFHPEWMGSSRWFSRDGGSRAILDEGFGPSCSVSIFAEAGPHKDISGQQVCGDGVGPTARRWNGRCRVNGGSPFVADSGGS